MLLFAYLYYWNETKSPQMTNIFLIKQLKIGNTTFENDLNVMSVNGLNGWPEEKQLHLKKQKQKKTTTIIQTNYSDFLRN